MVRTEKIPKRPESIGKYMSILLRRAHSSIGRDLMDLGIGPGQHMFLISLYKSDGVNMDTLTKRLMVDKATTTRAVSKLESLGYINRNIDPADGRAYLVYITPEGRAIVPRIRQALKEVMDHQTSGLSEDEREELMRILRKMVEGCRGGPMACSDDHLFGRCDP